MERSRQVVHHGSRIWPLHAPDLVLVEHRQSCRFAGEISVAAYRAALPARDVAIRIHLISSETLGLQTKRKETRQSFCGKVRMRYGSWRSQSDIGGRR
jgi:hypothetical protein